MFFPMFPYSSYFLRCFVNSMCYSFNLELPPNTHCYRFGSHGASKESWWNLKEVGLNGRKLDLWGVPLKKIVNPLLFLWVSVVMRQTAFSMICFHYKAMLFVKPMYPSDCGQDLCKPWPKINHKFLKLFILYFVTIWRANTICLFPRVKHPGTASANCYSNNEGL